MKSLSFFVNGNAFAVTSLILIFTVAIVLFEVTIHLS
jgi:hypothetical protein